MIKNYTVIFENKKFYVKETKTNHIMKKFSDKKLAWNMANALNRGKGFAGESPTFFAMKLNMV